jgi:hypothetical protein
MSKAMVDIGSEVWVDVASVLVVQPRFQNDDGVHKLPGCAVYLTGTEDPFYGSDPVRDVINRLASA